MNATYFDLKRVKLWLSELRELCLGLIQGDPVFDLAIRQMSVPRSPMRAKPKAFYNFGLMFRLWDRMTRIMSRPTVFLLPEKVAGH